MALWLTAAIAQEAESTLPSVLDARVTGTAERARLVLDLSNSTEFAIATLVDPRRIAVDVRAGNLDLGDLKQPKDGGMISGYEVEKLDEGRIRTWLRVSDPAKVQQAYVLDPIDDQPARLVVDMVPTTAEEFAALAERDREAAAQRLAQQADESETSERPDDQARTAENEVTPEKSQPRPLIVIDPGHGGIDAGAEAANGIKEKNIVLAFSKILQALLVKTGKFDVALTREDDEFLRLEERVALARQNQADLFISIHADYFQQQGVRGASVYTRDEKATDALDKVLAENENRRDIVAGFSVPKSEDRVVNILVDLMRREMRRQSFEAATTIVQELQPSVRLRRFPVRQADFFVLQAPDVPSILVELGFMSNAADIANLTAEAWRDKVAEALAEGITQYFAEQRNW